MITFQNGYSALMIASFNGYLEIVKTLIQAGANVNEADQVGNIWVDIVMCFICFGNIESNTVEYS